MKRFLYVFFTLTFIVGAGFVLAGSNQTKTAGESPLMPPSTPAVTGIVTKPAPSARIIEVKAPIFVQVKTANVVLLNAEIFEQAIDLVIQQLEAVRKANTGPAVLIITSPGGSVLAGARLVAYMDASPNKIITVCQTLCASMAAHIFEAGSSRLITDRSLLMFHRAAGGAQGTLEQMLSQLNAFKFMVDRMDANAANRSGIPYNEFKEIIGRDLWIDGYTAVNMKLADTLAFVQYDTESKAVFSLKQQLKLRNIIVPPTVIANIPASLRVLK